MSDMTERSGPEPGEPETGDRVQGTAPDAVGPVSTAAPPLDRLLAGRPPDRRHQRRWVPVTAALLSLLVGLAYIIEGLRKQSTETRMLYDKTKAALDALPVE